MRKQSLLVMGLLGVLVLLMWQVLPSWRELATERPVGQTPGAVSTSTSTAAEPVTEFFANRQKPYVIEWYADVGKGGVAWQLTVDTPKVQGFAYTSSSVFDAYGTVATTTDALVVTAYEPAGEVFAMASGNWDGTRFRGIMTQQSATSSIRVVSEVAQAVRLSFERVEGEWGDDKRGMQCDFSLRFPTVETGNGITRTIADQMNTAIRRTLLEQVGQTATQARDSFLRTCRTELEEEYRSWKGPVDAAGGMFRRSLSQDVTVAFNRAPYLSLNVVTYTYTGGAHGLTGSEGLVFDTRTGRQVAFRDLFRDATIEPVARFHTEVARRLLEEYRDELFEDNLQAIEAYLRTADRGTPTELVDMWSRGEMGFSTSSVFLIVPGGVQVIYQQYEIAPYAAGLPTVFLPINVWSSEASPDVRAALTTSR